MFCVRCGAEIAQAASFCGRCGIRLAPHIPASQSSLSSVNPTRGIAPNRLWVIGSLVGAILEYLTRPSGPGRTASIRNRDYTRCDAPRFRSNPRSIGPGIVQSPTHGCNCRGSPRRSCGSNSTPRKLTMLIPLSISIVALLPRAFRTVTVIGRKCRSVRTIFALASLAVTSMVWGGTRISGTYVAHGPTFAEMLQMTQTENGQITGVVSSVEVDADGEVKSDQGSLSGAFDSGQITLTFHPGLFASSFAGSASGTTVHLEAVGSKGEVLSWTFVRSSPEIFKGYVVHLKSSAESLILTKDLLKRAQELNQAVATAEAWKSNAELDAQKIPTVKGYFQNIEDRMTRLVAKERISANSVARSQISVAVIQGEVAGTQADLQVDQLWDRSIGDPGRQLQQALANYGSACSTREDFRSRGATKEAVDQWESACKGANEEHARFEPIFKQITDQRAELRSFQVAAKSRREALVREANRIQ
jgi:hypothetical protein